MNRTNFYGLAARTLFQLEEGVSEDQQWAESKSSDGQSSMSSVSVNAMLAQFRASQDITDVASSTGDSDSVSTITVHTSRTDVILLSDPACTGVGGILSFTGPTADNESVSRPSRPGKKVILEHQQGSLDSGVEVVPDGIVRVYKGKSFDTEESIDPHDVVQRYDDELNRRSKRLQCFVGLGFIVVLAAVGVTLPLVLHNSGGSEDKDSFVPAATPRSISPKPSINAFRLTNHPSSLPALQRSLHPSPSPSVVPSLVPSASASPSALPSNSPSTVPSSAPTSLKVFLIDLLSVQSPGSVVRIMEDISSPQAVAFEWLQSNTALASQSDRIILQRFALATFYYSTAGDQWRRKDGWLIEEDECLWYSQSISPCNRDGEYTDLNLPGNTIAGSLPAELVLFAPSLTRMSLPTNSLSGAIPTVIGQLSKLETLDLAANSINGSLPSELGLLSNLMLFSVFDSQVSGVLPLEIANLSKLAELYIANSLLVGEVPSGVCHDIPFLDQLWADCAEVSCECCTTCCYDSIFCDAV